MKKIFAAALLAGVLAGCAGFRNWSTGCSQSMVGGTYLVRVWSGGACVEKYVVNGYINSEAQSDGWYFKTDDGKFHRVAGTVTIDQQ